MAKESKSERVETSILPVKYVDLVEDVFHAILAISLFYNWFRCLLLLHKEVN